MRENLRTERVSVNLADDFFARASDDDDAAVDRFGNKIFDVLAADLVSGARQSAFDRRETSRYKSVIASMSSKFAFEMLKSFIFINFKKARATRCGSSLKHSFPERRAIFGG
jgi:hypothetical protein